MQDLKLSEIYTKFPTEDDCLEEIKRIKFPEGIKCVTCNKTTKHYKIKDRKAYSCKQCRNQVYPLSGTIFEKSTTPLSTWFFAMYIMTLTFGNISIKKLQEELGVTYKTAWRISKYIKFLMSLNNGDLLTESKDVFTLNIFNAIEFNVVSKKKSSS